MNNQQIHQPVVVADVMNGQTIAMLQAVYPLTEADFLRLKGGPPVTAAAAVMIFSGVVGYAIGLGPKLQSIIFSDQEIWGSGEIKTIVGWSIVSLVVYMVGRWVPNDRTSVMRTLTDHFKDAKASTHIMGNGK